jgi:hypothetical protein
MLEAFGKGASEEMQRCKRVIDAQVRDQDFIWCSDARNHFYKSDPPFLFDKTPACFSTFK